MTKEQEDALLADSEPAQGYSTGTPSSNEICYCAKSAIHEHCPLHGSSASPAPQSDDHFFRDIVLARGADTVNCSVLSMLYKSRDIEIAWRKIAETRMESLVAVSEQRDALSSAFASQTIMWENALKERDDAVALNQQYHLTRTENRDFAKNAQQQRDDWLAEVHDLRAERDRLLSRVYRLEREVIDTRELCESTFTEDTLIQEVARLQGELFTVIMTPEDWPEMPSCQVLGDGRIRVSWKILSELLMKHKNAAYAESDRLKIALTAITRNQSEKEGQEGICPFGCDAPWIALSALGLWKDEKVEAWKP